MKLLETLLKVPYFEKYCPINKKEPVEGLDKVSADIEKEFDNEPVYNEETLKTKIECHGDEVTDFYEKNNSIIR